MHITFRRCAAGLCVGLLLSSCVGPSTTDATVGSGTLELAIQPALVSGPADATAEPVNLIRAIVLRSPDDVEVARVDVPVSPDAAEWELSVPVPVEAEEMEVSVRLSLINAVDGTQAVQFSGITPPFSLSAGGVASPADVSLVRGPLANLSVLGVFVTSTPPDLLVEETASASAALEFDTSVEGTPRVFWVSTDPSVATVDDSLVTAVSAGSTQLIAVAGAHADTVGLEVLPRYSSVALSPDSVSVVGFGSTATFTASVIDGRGDPVADPSLAWSSVTPEVVASSGAGVFEAVGLGSGQPRVALTDAPSLTATAEMVVEPIIGDLAVRKTTSTSQATPGDTLSFQVSVNNNANFPATQVVVLDTLPDGVQLVSATASVGIWDAAEHRWTLDEMAAGAAETLTLEVAVELTAANDTLVNRAWVVPPPDYQDQEPANDMAQATVFTVDAPAPADPTGVLAFTSERSGTRDLWLKDLDSGALTQLTQGSIFASGPEFSPDGSRIALSDNADEIFVMNSDGSGMTSLTGPATTSSAGAPVWSPDGAFVAYQGVDGDWEIAVVEVADTANKVFLTNNAVQDQYPDWSPDGTRIAFSRDQEAIVTVRASDGGDEQVVYQGFNRFPKWSPDGTEIVFYAGGPILAVNVQTGAVRTILSDDADNWYPDWSPDGAWVIVSKVPAFPGDFQLWAVRSDGSQEQVQVETSTSSDFDASWTASIPPG